MVFLGYSKTAGGETFPLTISHSKKMEAEKGIFCLLFCFVFFSMPLQTVIYPRFLAFFFQAIDSHKYRDVIKRKKKVKPDPQLLPRDGPPSDRGKSTTFFHTIYLYADIFSFAMTNIDQ